MTKSEENERAEQSHTILQESSSSSKWLRGVNLPGRFTSDPTQLSQCEICDLVGFDDDFVIPCSFSSSWFNGSQNGKLSKI